MKKIIILTLLFVTAKTSIGQVKEKTVDKMYVQFAAGVSSKNGGFTEAGIQAKIKKNWVTTFSYHSISMDTKNLPKDYIPGYTMLFFFEGNESTPRLNMKAYSFTGGKVFEAGKKIWFTTEAGFSIVNSEILSFTRKPVTTEDAAIFFGFLFSSSNYDVKKENKTVIGGMLKADFNWAFSSFAGIGVGVFANFNSIQSPVGAQVKLIIGWMNRKKN